MTTNKTYDIVGNIIAYENGDMTDDQAITLFQHLLDTGYINHLQGHYGRTAKYMIDNGVIEPTERQTNEPL